MKPKHSHFFVRKVFLHSFAKNSFTTLSKFVHSLDFSKEMMVWKTSQTGIWNQKLIKKVYKCYFFKNYYKNHTWNHSLMIFVLCITVFASSFWKNQQKINFFFLTSNKFEKRRRKHEKCVNWFILIYFNVYLRWNIVCLHIQNTW